MRLKKVVALIALSCMLMVLASSVFAANKAVAGYVLGTDGTPVADAEVIVHVDVIKNVGGVNTVFSCHTEPVYTGIDGSYSTNFGNLIYDELPDSSCSSDWDTGDDIWATMITKDGEEGSTGIATVEFGNGVQLLGDILIEKISPAGAGKTGGESSGGEVSIRRTGTYEPSTETIESVKLLRDKVEIVGGDYSLENGKFLSSVQLKNKEGAVRDLIMVMTIRKLYGKTVFEKQVPDISLGFGEEKEFSFEASIEEGFSYEVEFVLYKDGVMLDVYDIGIIYPKALEPKQPKPGVTLTIEKKKYILFIPVIMLIIILVIAFLFYKKKKEESKKFQKKRRKRTNL